MTLPSPGHTWAAKRILLKRKRDAERAAAELAEKAAVELAEKAAAELAEKAKSKPKKYFGLF